jgi:hypothetical protein
MALCHRLKFDRPMAKMKGNKKKRKTDREREERKRSR